MPKKLTAVMLKSLRAIDEAGGLVYCMGGGWWGTKEGNYICYETGDWRGSDTVGTNTIYALENRGLLERMNIYSKIHQDTRLITDAGRTALAASK